MGIITQQETTTKKTILDVVKVHCVNCALEFAAAFRLSKSINYRNLTRSKPVVLAMHCTY